MEDKKDVLMLDVSGIYEELESDIKNQAEAQILKTILEVADVLIRKNRDYDGASFTQGTIGNVVHIHDKATRYKNLVYKSIRNPNLLISAEVNAANFENVEDTVKDIIGYAVLGLIILQKNGERYLDPVK